MRAQLGVFGKTTAVVSVSDWLPYIFCVLLRACFSFFNLIAAKKERKNGDREIATKLLHPQLSNIKRIMVCFEDIINNIE